MGVEYFAVQQNKARAATKGSSLNSVKLEGLHSWRVTRIDHSVTNIWPASSWMIFLTGVLLLCIISMSKSVTLIKHVMQTLSAVGLDGKCKMIQGMKATCNTMTPSGFLDTSSQAAQVHHLSLGNRDSISSKMFGKHNRHRHLRW